MTLLQGMLHGMLHGIIFIIGLFGFLSLALAMPKHSKHLIQRELSFSLRVFFRVMGWCLLGIALALGVYGWRLGIGMVTWLGWLTVAGILLAFVMPRWPWQAKKSQRSERSTRNTGRASDVVSHPRFSSAQLTMMTCIALLIPAASFSWSLLNTPQKPLLREDAIHGQVGAWQFVIAQTDLEEPQLVALDVPVKQFQLRFCDGCEREIRAAYLKIRKPHLETAAGNGFTGRGLEKTAVIPIPRAATLNDGIWLTVVGNNGVVLQQELSIAQLSPELAHYIETRNY